MKNTRTLASSNAEEHKRQIEKMNLKGLVWRVIEEIFNSVNLEEIKRNLGDLMVGAIHVVEFEQIEYRKKPEKQWKEGDDEQKGAFLEEKLASSMMNKGCDTPSPPLVSLNLLG